MEHPGEKPELGGKLPEVFNETDHIPTIQVIPETELIKGKMIGKGSFGIVHECILKQTRAKYALKSFSLDCANPEKRETILRMFERDANILAKLDHPNLVKLIGISKTENEMMMITDLLDGSLSRVLETRLDEVRMKLRSCWFSQTQLVQWCIEILSGLEYLHNIQIAHRDLKVIEHVIPTQSISLRIFWFIMVKQG